MFHTSVVAIQIMGKKNFWHFWLLILVRTLMD